MQSENQSTIENEYGVCTYHNRSFECFSITSNQQQISFSCLFSSLICADCLMYGPNKGDEVCHPKEAIGHMNARLKEAEGKGKLRREATDSILLDIRQTILSFKESKQKNLDATNKLFKDIEHVVKDRQNEIMEEIDEYYDKQMEDIKKARKKWLAKQERTKKLLDLQRSDDDLAILQHGKTIGESLDDLKEGLELKMAVILKNMDTHFFHKEDKKKEELCADEFKQYLGKYITKGELLNVRYHC